MLRAHGTWLPLLASLLLGATVVVGNLEGWVARGLDLDKVLDEEQSRAAGMLVERVRISQRVKARREVALAFSGGQTSLKDAAAQFRRLDREPPVETWSWLQTRFPDITGEAFHALTVLDFLRTSLEGLAPMLDRVEAARLLKAHNIDLNTPCTNLSFEERIVR